MRACRQPPRPDGGGTLPGHVPHSRDDFDHYSQAFRVVPPPPLTNEVILPTKDLPRVPGCDGFSVRAGEVRPWGLTG